MYKHLKTDFAYERYLDIVRNTKYRHLITQIRVSAHKLRIETGRYGRNRVDRNQRLCQLCNTQEIEDESHFLFKCDTYSDIRRHFIKRCYRVNPSAYKLIQLLNSHNDRDLYNLAKYMEKAYTIRANILNNIR